MIQELAEQAIYEAHLEAVRALPIDNESMSEFVRELEIAERQREEITKEQRTYIVQVLLDRINEKHQKDLGV